jgi:NAD(P)-dependent dehydrogenase (short-subunit alcohol dehydrogenase family)
VTSNLQGARVLITGGFGVLGTTTAIAAARRGARVALIDQATQPPGELLESCGPDAVTLPGINLAVVDEATRAVHEIQQRLGGLDVLINIAGAFRWQTVTEGDPATTSSRSRARRSSM